MAEKNLPPAGLDEGNKKTEQSVEMIKGKEVVERNQPSVFDAGIESSSNPLWNKPSENFHTNLLRSPQSLNIPRKSLSLFNESYEYASVPQASAAGILKQLNDMVSSASKQGSTEAKAIEALKNLKYLAFDDKCRKRKFSDDDLRKVGISEDDIPGLNTIVTFKKSKKGHHIGSFVTNLLRRTFFVLKAVELKDDGFRSLVSKCFSSQSRAKLHYEELHYAETTEKLRLLGEILCNPEFRRTTEKFVSSDGEALEKKRKILIDFLKTKFQHFVSSSGDDLLFAIRVISSCGDDVKRIVPEVIPKLDLSDTRLTASDVATLCNFICHGSLLRCLSMCYSSLTSETLQILADGLRRFNLKLSKLDVSWNKNMGTAGLSSIGSIVKNNKVDKLKMMHCGLMHEELESFNKHLDGAKISDLDVSGNMKMGTSGLSSIGRIVMNAGVNKLRMTYCKLTHEELESLSRLLDSTKLSELDVSENRNMGANGLSFVGKIVTNNNVDKLKMKFCDLKHEELELFNEHSDGAKISQLDVSGNTKMGINELTSVGRIAKNKKVDKLKMKKCGLNHEELESFNKFLDGTKIKQLDLSSQERFNPEYNFPLSTTSNLFPNVTEFLDLTLNELGIEEIYFLQDKLHCLHPTELKIRITRQDISTCSLPDLTSELTSEEYCKLPNAANIFKRMKAEGLEKVDMCVSLPNSGIVSFIHCSTDAGIYH